MGQLLKIATIIGARPQFIKASAVNRAITEHNRRQRQSEIRIDEIIIHTGQHFDSNMSDIFFTQLKIPKPKYNLGINCLSHGAMTGKMLEKIENVLLKEKPDWVFVYGDTNSTLAGALAAKKLLIKVAHVEAGLRSFNMKMPEEINRILTDRISNVLFCPTDNAVENLKREGFYFFDCKIVKCGDVMYDVALHYSDYAYKPEKMADSLDLSNQKYILATIHREENTDNLEVLKDIFKAFNEISHNNSIVIPLHPRTNKKLTEFGFPLEDNITIIEPVGYLEMIYLLKNCLLVMTDSGGLQKESYFFKKKCITLRQETEWEELVDLGANIVAGTEKENILKCYKIMLERQIKFNSDLYGKGNSGELIVNTLISLNENDNRAKFSS